MDGSIHFSWMAYIDCQTFVHSFADLVDKLM